MNKNGFLAMSMTFIFGLIFMSIGACAFPALGQTVAVPTAEALAKTESRVSAAEQRLEAVEAAIRKLQAPTVILPAVPEPVRSAPAAGTICGVRLEAKNALADYVDAHATTRVWREKITACGAALSVMFWNQGAHWMMTAERVVPNLFATRAAPVAFAAELSVGGKIVAKIDGPLYEFQISYLENQPLKPMGTPEQLRAAKLVPPIKLLRTYSSHWAVKPYTSLKDGPLERGMPNTGERADIGVVHEWCSLYLNTGDTYWWTACLDAAKDQANIPWHVTYSGRANLFTDVAMRDAGFDARNERGLSGVIALPTAPHPKLMFVSGKPNPPYDYDGKTTVAWTLDTAHQPNALLVPYMSTRHPYFLYLAQFQVGQLLGCIQSPPGFGGRYKHALPTLCVDQPRGVAWGLRSMSQAVLMTPDATPDWLHSKTIMRDLLRESVTKFTAYYAPERDYWVALRNGVASKPPEPPMYRYTVKATGVEAWAVSPWERDYLTQAVGFARWAGALEVEALDAILRDILVARYGTGSSYRRMGAPFTAVFSDRAGVLAKSMDDVLKFSPSENLTYGTNAPLVVGTGDTIGQNSPNFWQPQGALWLCAANGDERCTEPLAWYNAQAEKIGQSDFDKYRLAD
jgi:hypothetical protein